MIPYSANPYHNIHVQLRDVALQKKLTWHKYPQLYGLYDCLIQSANDVNPKYADCIKHTAIAVGK